VCAVAKPKALQLVFVPVNEVDSTVAALIVPLSVAVLHLTSPADVLKTIDVVWVPSKVVLELSE
jgi:hypothetical protein